MIEDFNMKMEIELTDSQAEKVESLKANGISVGEAIEMFFEMKEDINRQSDAYIENKISKANKRKAELEAELSKVDDEIKLYEDLKDSPQDHAKKQKILQKAVLENDTYDKYVQKTKRKYKWSMDIFKG